MFSGGKKGCIRNEWVKHVFNHDFLSHSYIFHTRVRRGGISDITHYHFHTAQKMKFCIKDSVKFDEEILTGKFHFFA